ncbi:MAG: ATP-binding cassette domain-containing protein [Actinobacteria bacterium]|nr:ATP-binding cassette domain-containing protein [Actinomycetota bacterium]
MAEHAIDVEGLVREYKKGPRAVDGVDLYVERGEIYGFLGPNGAGKSTMVKMLVTLLPPSGGRATVGGFDIATQGDQVRRIIGVALQEAALDPLLTGREHLYLQAGLNGFPKKQAKERQEELLERVGLSGAGDRKIGTYSGGMRRRLDLALSLVHSPSIIFLDEPTTGLDPHSRNALWEEVRRLARDEGVTIFLTTQYLEEADVLARRVGIIDHGKIVAEGTPEELKAQIGGSTLEVTPALASDRERLETTLSRFGSLAPTSGENGTVGVRLRDRGAAVAEIVRALDQAGVEIANLTLRSPTLDDVFLAKTGRALEAGEGEPEAEPPAGAEAAVVEPEVDLRMAAAGRSKIERLPTAMLKDWMAERHLQEAIESGRRGTPALKITKGPLAGQQLTVKDRLVIGREGDLVIADPEISRRHCVIRVVDGTLVIDDLQSLNGSWINGKRIELPTLLAPGDVITLGTSAIEVTPPPAPSLVSGPAA